MYLSMKWDALPLGLVWNHIMLPYNHSVKIVNSYTLTLIFPDSSPYANLLEGSGNITLSNLKILPLTFHIQGNIYLTKNCFAEVLSSILTIIPYVNFTCALDCWWRKFPTFCVCQLLFSLHMLAFNNLELVKLKVLILTIWTKNDRRNCACVVSGIAGGGDGSLWPLWGNFSEGLKMRYLLPYLVVFLSAPEPSKDAVGLWTGPSESFPQF